MVAFALIMFLPRLMNWDYLQFIKRILRRGSNDFTGPRTLELLESSIRQSGPGRVEEVSYDRVEKIIKTNSYLYIYLGVLTAFVIPLNAFKSDCDFEDFMATIVDKTDQKLTLA